MGSPTTTEKAKDYSRELLKLNFSKRFEVAGRTSRLISFYTQSRCPTDFFVYEHVIGKYTKDLLKEVDLTLVYSKNVSEEQAHYAWINPNVSFYIYKIQSSESNGYYIGRRKIGRASPTVEECIEDPYMGSGGQKFQNWLKSLDSSTCYKTILSIVSTKSEAVAEEERAVGELYSTDPNCKNSYRGGVGYAALSWESHIREDICKLHGKTKFFLKDCYKCRNKRIVTQKFCLIHGLSTHQGEICCSCSLIKSITLLECEVHGNTKHLGRACYKCSIDSQWSIGDCAIHGQSKFQSGACKRCSTLKHMEQRMCEIHGESTFYSDACRKCQLEATISLRECSLHGETIYRGSSCAKCATSTKDRVAICEKHGETQFQYSKCGKCIAADRDSIKTCFVHGEVKHRGDSCYSCTIENSNSEKECSRHGRVLHRGDTCCKCSSEKAVHKRHHENKGIVKLDCRLCSKEDSSSLG